eukprot:3549282-Amphidinium_carterae.1
MPRSAQTTAEQIQNWERKAVEANIALVEQKITVAMRHRPSIVMPLWDKCQALGVTDANLAEVDLGFEKSRAARARDRQKQEAAARKAQAA